jgi:hypothetical protein
MVMKRLIAGLVLVLGVLLAKGAVAQTALPRAGWVANASSSGGSDLPSRAIDSSSGSRWTTGTDQTSGQWFSLDMVQPQTFSEITIDAAGSTNDYARGYQVFVSNDAVNWGAPVASGSAASAGVQTIVFTTQTARFIGIVQTGSGSNWWSIAEINVYGPGAMPTVTLSPTGWVATASVTGSSSAAGQAIDGSLSTRWTTGTNQVSGQWFQLDMLQSQTIVGLTMNSDGSSSDYARGYQVFVSDDTANWGTSVASGTGSSSGRYLKIVQTGSASNWWSIAELTVLGVGSFAPTAQALPRTGWIASASVSCSSDVPSHALDDDLLSRYSTCQTQSAGQTFQVDMLTAQSFTRITLDAGGSSGDYPRSYALYVSQDGVNWGNAIASGTGTAQLITMNFSYQNARYLKVVDTGSTSSNWWSIAELNVYGVAPYLLMREGWIASTSANGASAYKGLDGNLSTRWTTSSSQSNGQWYQIDMGGPQLFNELLLNADGASSDYPTAYQVLVSNDGSTWSAPIAAGSGSSSLVAIGVPAQSARYVRIMQTGSSSNWWSIAEIDVFSPVSIQPNAQCVIEHDATHYTAVFGYTNRGAGGVAIPVGQQNSITGQVVQGQPSTFDAGAVSNAVLVDFDGSPLTWQVMGASATASSATSRCTMPCVGDIPLGGATLVDGSTIDGERTFSSDYSFQLPSQFAQVGGTSNSSDRLTLTYTDGSGVARSCTYASGGAGTFSFASCSAGATTLPGVTVAARVLSAHLAMASAPSSPTVVWSTIHSVDSPATCAHVDPPFNLAIDVDHDGIPDQLSTAIDALRVSPHFVGDLINFSARLPFSSTVRQLNSQLSDLIAASWTASASDASDLADRSLNIDAGLISNPQYVLAQQAMKSKLQTPMPPPACVLVYEIDSHAPVGCKPGPQFDGIKYNRDTAVTCTFNPSNATCSATMATGRVHGQFPGWDYFKRGDIMLRTYNAAWKEWLWVKKWSHAAMWNSEDPGNFTIYESVASGVHVSRLSDFVAGGAEIATGYNNVVQPTLARSAYDAGHVRYGDDDTCSYNFNFARPKDDDSPSLGGHGPHSVYCSQMVYKVHKLFTNVDLDSNSRDYAIYEAKNGVTWGVVVGYVVGGPAGAWIGGLFGGSAGATIAQLAVAPDEIADSGNATYVFSGLAPPAP